MMLGLFVIFFFITIYEERWNILWNFVFVENRVQYGLIVVKTFSEEHIDDK